MQQSEVKQTRLSKTIKKSCEELNICFVAAVCKLLTTDKPKLRSGTKTLAGGGYKRKRISHLLTGLAVYDDDGYYFDENDDDDDGDDDDDAADYVVVVVVVDDDDVDDAQHDFDYSDCNVVETVAVVAVGKESS
ncbi:hypothetical protein GQX74_007320 [Glossina fuscipes]|nr:hypothetical protein GQX74_007320 [Glossina fuscipes]